MALNLGQADDDEEGLDPKVVAYLKQQMGAASAERTPEYQASLRADAADAAAQKRSNNLSALLMNSAAKFGTIGGKAADTSGYEKFTQDQNKGIDQGQAEMAAQNKEADAIDPRVMQYLARSDQTKARKDALAQSAAQFKERQATDQGRWDADRTQRAELAKAGNQSKEEIAQARADAAAARAEAVAAGKTGKASRDQDLSYRDMGLHDDAARGDPATQKAGVNLLNIKAAKDLISQYANGDDMPEGDYNLLVSELSKVSSGGVGSQHSQEAIAQKTLLSELQKARSFLGGGVNGAELGAFIKNNKRYLDLLEKTNQEQVDNHRRKNFGFYQNLIGQENQDRFRSENPNLFQDAQTAAQGVGNVPKKDTGSGVAQAASPPPSAHPEASAAMQWAKANPDDPRAKEIMKRLGGQ